MATVREPHGCISDRMLALTAHRCEQIGCSSDQSFEEYTGCRPLTSVSTSHTQNAVITNGGTDLLYLPQATTTVRPAAISLPLLLLAPTAASRVCETIPRVTLCAVRVSRSQTQIVFGTFIYERPPYPRAPNHWFFDKSYLPTTEPVVNTLANCQLGVLRVFAPKYRRVEFSEC